mgnify:CR=1 FL=1
MLPYFDLSDTQFEQVVVAIGQRMFGAGLIGFTKGKDGGRDAKFHGTADCYPSQNAPWVGCTIVQAKHTYAINASFSDNDFCNFEKRTGILFDELPRIIALVEAGEAQNYLVISNRRLSGIVQPKLVDLVSSETGLDRASVAVLGSQQLDDLLELFPEAKSSVSINPLQMPLIVRPDDLAEVIEGIREATQLVSEDEDRSVPTPPDTTEGKKSDQQHDGRVRGDAQKALLQRDGHRTTVPVRPHQRAVQSILPRGGGRVPTEDRGKARRF